MARVQSTVACEGRVWNYMCRIRVAVDRLCRVRCYDCDTAAIGRHRSQHHQHNHLSLLYRAGHCGTSQNHAF